MAMTSEQLLKSISSSGTLAAGGKLNPDQADKFIDLMMEKNQFMSAIQIRRLSGPQGYVETLGIGSRLIRKGTEGTVPTETATANTGRKTLTTVETILPVDLSLSFLEDNIEKAGAEDHIMGMFAKQFSIDLEDLGVNGDESVSTGDDADFLSINNGWLKILQGAGAKSHKIDTASYDGTSGKEYSKAFEALITALPDKYTRDPENMFIYVSPTVDMAYRKELGQRATALGDTYLTERRPAYFLGFEVKPISFLPAKTMLLLNPLNLAMGIQREITVDREKAPRKRVMEYTITARTDFEIAVEESCAIGWAQA